MQNTHFSDGLPGPSTSTHSGNIDSNIQKVSKVGMLLNNHEILLSTVLVKVKDISGDWQIARGILDSGAQSSFITRSFANKLGLRKYHTNMSLHGLDSMNAIAHAGINCTISSLHDVEFTLDTTFIILDKICENVPAVSYDESCFNFIPNLSLADPQFNQSHKVDMLFGNDIYPYVMREGRIYFGPEQPVCLNTCFGWTIMGRLATKPPYNKIVNTFFTLTESNHLDSILQKFWEIEEMPSSNHISPEEKYCRDHYAFTVFREENSRFVVSMPFKVLEPDFGDSRSLALGRFLSLERRLLLNKSNYLTYSEVMQDYLDQGHMTQVSFPGDLHYDYFYIPHHAIFKKDSSTTPLRVVYDASSHAAGKLSLNNAVFTGPKLQQDLGAILLSFRLHKIVFTCDIKQMYRMIKIHPDQRRYQRILWRFSPSDPIREYEINVVLFGVACSPYLAIQTLLHLADEYSDLPLASEAIRKSTFVDDVTSGSMDLNGAILLGNKLIELLARGGFEVRKWTSNEPKLLAKLPESHIQTNALSFDQESENVQKILGLKWSSVKDYFFFSFDNSKMDCYTKRTILSDLARMFDPLGFLTPITFFAKLVIQHLWSLGLQWDEALPLNVWDKCTKFKDELSLLQDFHMPREIDISSVQAGQLVGFCDASANKYLRQIFAECVAQETLSFRFNPPASPHMGGIWESNIKCVKTHLLRVVGIRILTYEELSTVLT
ncbi:uncharacterized protein LOC126741415 [Anthonomus grandis grandis]|uniref:uncharacterized protein LOC126741415 n=1 Tax=Anthonomus grandis grandis TaxID=2921223 RepID=UPI002164F43C|nr:uncharacterized protein LOC126741415 [Anthonomus grandis grandis]